MHETPHKTGFERALSLFTRVQPGEGRCVAILTLQAFALMSAWYLVRPVREALILTEGGAEFRSWAVAVQAGLLILVIPAYAALTRRMDASDVFRRVSLFFAANLAAFAALGLSGLRFGFVFFVWASVFGVMAVTQFWAFATDLFEVRSGQRLFGVIAVGVSAGAFAGAYLAGLCFDAAGPWGLMLASALALAGAAALSAPARAAVPPGARSTSPRSEGPAPRWLGGFSIIARSRYLAGIAALVVLLNWITSTGDFVLSGWLVEVAGRESPEDPASWIGAFMGRYCSIIALLAFLMQLLLVSRIIQVAGLPRALLVTPVAFAAGWLVVGIVPLFLVLQSVLVIQRSFDYSLLNTARNALLLPASREVKYQAKTAIDTFFFRAGDLLSTATIWAGLRLFTDPRTQFLWLIVLLGATMALVAWLVGREYARRSAASRDSAAGGCRDPGPRAVPVQ